uniref:Calcineurin-like phosphoesterase domain-containing protein n=1 Tax=Coccolithus braarudii TaxID=221442 RepID=A0A7S0LGU6_9EUKA
MTATAVPCRVAMKEVVFPRRALTLATKPTKAWELVRAAQGEPERLPLHAFSADREQQPGTARFVAISDTHNQESTMSVPMGDVLIHAGDFTQTGSIEQIASFSEWFGSLPHPRKVLIAGNHDLSLHRASFEATSRRFGLATPNPDGVCTEATRILQSIPGCEYLCDSGTSAFGVTIWGSPWSPEFCHWAFNLPRGQPCRGKWCLIPAGTDVVVTHGPPLGHGDLCASEQRAGCLNLLDELQSRVRPKYHIFGHIHEGYGATTDGVTTYLNASSCSLRYRVEHAPLVFDMPCSEAKIT